MTGAEGRSVHLEIEAFGRTDIGRKRDHNEDDFLCLDLAGRSAAADSDWLLAVADGIGGHIGGAQASAAAVRILQEAFPLGGKAGLLPGIRCSPPAGPPTPRSSARPPASPARPAWARPWSPPWSAPTRAFVTNVGDSRAYVVRGQAALSGHPGPFLDRRAEGHRRPDRGGHRASPFRRMVTRSLGYEDKVQIDGFEVELERGDTLLLCSDGLYGPVPERILGRAFRRSARSAPNSATGSSAWPTGGADPTTSPPWRPASGPPAGPDETPGNEEKND